MVFLFLLMKRDEVQVQLMREGGWMCWSHVAKCDATRGSHDGDEVRCSFFSVNHGEGADECR